MAEDIDFNELYDTCARDVYICILSKCKNKEDAEDLVAETFALAYENLETFKNMEHAEKWLYIVAKNLFFNLYKKQKRKKRLFDEVAATTVENYDEDKGIYDIAGVTDTDKQIIFYKYFKQYSNYEIAQMLSINVNTVKSRIRRALRKLKNYYEGRYEN